MEPEDRKLHCEKMNKVIAWVRGTGMGGKKGTLFPGVPLGPELILDHYVAISSFEHVLSEEDAVISVINPR